MFKGEPVTSCGSLIIRRPEKPHWSEYQLQHLVSCPLEDLGWFGAQVKSFETSHFFWIFTTWTYEISAVNFWHFFQLVCPASRPLSWTVRPNKAGWTSIFWVGNDLTIFWQESCPNFSDHLAGIGRFFAKKNSGSCSQQESCFWTGIAEKRGESEKKGTRTHSPKKVRSFFMAKLLKFETQQKIQTSKHSESMLAATIHIQQKALL